MAFRQVGNVDADYNKGLILSDADGNTAMVWTGAKLTNSQPAHVAIVDGSGTQITSFGGGTQYAELTTTDPGTGTLALGRYKTAAPTLTDGQMYGLQLDVNGNLKVTSSGGGGGDVNLTQIAGNAVNAGTGVVGTGTLRTTLATDVSLPTLFLNGNSTTWKDDSGFGEDVTSGVGTVMARLWDGSGYDRQPGNSTDGALVNLGANNDVTVTGTVTVTEAAPTTTVAFATDIPTAGTRVQLASNAIKAVVIQAATANTGLIYVGGSNVSSTVRGAELQPGQSVGMAIDNTSDIWVDTATNGNDVLVLGSA